MKLSEFKKQIEDAIIEILNEEDSTQAPNKEEAQKRVQDANKALNQAKEKVATKQTAAKNNPSNPLDKKEVDTAVAQQKAAEKEAETAKQAASTASNVSKPPQKP
jgi:hypothetical protein